VQRQIDVGLDIPDPQPDLYNPTLSLTMDLQPCSEDRAWSLRSTSSHSLDKLFQSHGNSDLEFHGTMVDVSPRAHQNNQDYHDKTLESCCSLAIKRDSSHLGSFETPSPPKRAMTMSQYRDIVSKPTGSSAEVIEGIGSNNTEPQGPKKGCRRGPLEPEKRQKASKMRGRRACAPCYTSHIAVSGKPRIG
jgi:hypothetical protein